MADRKQDRYTLGYGSQITQWHGERTADREAAFFLPHIKPGMRLLDFGCGNGAITVGLAETIAPGEVVGIDVESSQVERAITLAKDRGVKNVRFEVGSVYELPFPPASFDAAFAHAVLQHLNDPLRACV